MCITTQLTTINMKHNFIFFPLYIKNRHALQLVKKIQIIIIQTNIFMAVLLLFIKAHKSDPTSRVE